MATGDQLADAELLIKLSKVEEKLGKYAEALRWTEQARRVLNQLPGDKAARHAAWAGAWNAFILQREGRTPEALECAAEAAAAAEAASDPESAGEAYAVIGWIKGAARNPEAQPMMQRALEAFERSGNLVRQAELLNNLGVVCQWEGRWDEALSYYERGRDAAAKIGSTVSTGLARINMSEILIDRGEWAEAEVMLLETLPLWKSSGYRYWLGACLSYLGRVSLRLGRYDEAINRLEESKANFLEVGAEPQAVPVDAWIAECRVAMGNPEAALQQVNGMLGRAAESSDIAAIVPLLERIQGHALLLQDDLWGARDALERSLAAAREHQDLFEATLTMLSLIELDRLEGVEPPLEMVNETRSLLASRKVRAVPSAPLPPR